MSVCAGCSRLVRALIRGVLHPDARPSLAKVAGAGENPSGCTPEYIYSASAGCVMCDIVLRQPRDGQAVFKSWGRWLKPGLALWSVAPAGEQCVGVETVYMLISWRGVQDEVAVRDPIDPLFWSPEVLRNDARFQRVKGWLKECKQNHASCRKPAMAGYPRRLLDLSQFRSHRRVKLVDTTATLSGRSKYITLSHCWGLVQPLTTTKSNLREHKIGIPTSRLPKTFYDAARIARWLEYSFIWIDSLCIVQDSREDWEREAACMAAIYANAKLTISATSSADCHGGCFIDDFHSGTVCAPFSMNMDSISTTNIHEQYNLSLRPLSMSVSTAVATRGWILQETVLSRRVLHMTSSQMFWHCGQCFQSEDGIMVPGGAGGQMTRPCFRELKFMWHEFPIRQLVPNINTKLEWQRRDLVQDYSARSFSMERDRLAAMSGIAKFHKLRTKDEFILGLWASTFWKDIAWSIMPDQTRSTRIFDDEPSDDPKSQLMQHNRTVYPTWTWLSVSGAISYSDVFNAASFETTTINNESHSIAPQIKKWNVEWSGIPYVSQLTASALHLHAKVLHLRLHVDLQRYDAATKDTPFLNREDLRMVKEDYYQSDGTMFSEQPRGRLVTCLLLGESATVYAYYILLAKVGQDASRHDGEPVASGLDEIAKYRRIGIGRVRMRTSQKEAFIQKFEWEMVELI